jgi:hypothetical protein
MALIPIIRPHEKHTHLTDHRIHADFGERTGMC